MPATRQLLARHNVLPSFDKSYFTPKLAGIRIRTSEFLKKASNSRMTQTFSSKHASDEEKGSSGRAKPKRNSLDQWGYVSEVKPEEDTVHLTTRTTTSESGRSSGQ